RRAGLRARAHLHGHRRARGRPAGRACALGPAARRVAGRDPVKVDPARLARDLDALAEIGRDPAGGMTRLALTPAHAAARAYVRRAMAVLDLHITHDEVGNLLGRWGGEGPAVMTGSHLDSVPRGGRYDGPLGVVGGVEAVRALKEAGVRPARPIEVVVFTGE